MSELLSYEEYQAIADSLNFPATAFIDGHFRPSVSEQTFPTINPATGKVLNNVSACNATDVGFAVEKAREAFDQGRWSKLHQIYDQTAPCGDDAMAMIIREPVGVVGCVLPWNFPLLMLALH